MFLRDLLLESRLAGILLLLERVFGTSEKLGCVEAS